MTSADHLKSPCAGAANPQTLQILRTIDKLDRVGLEGVKKLLSDGRVDQSGATIEGCGLRPFQIEFMAKFLKCQGENNHDTLSKLDDFFDRTNCRFAVIEMLEDGEGETAWDRLLGLPKNLDQTWSNGGRPENIGWALDDLFKVLTKRSTP